MDVEHALEKLRDLLKGWGLRIDDFIITGQYAQKLQGYEREVREGHLNTIINKEKVDWSNLEEEAAEVTPPKDFEGFKGFKKWIDETGFNTDFHPKDPEKFKEIRKDSILYTLPNGKDIRIVTPVGDLKGIEGILSHCTEEGLGIEKGKKMLQVVENLRDIVKGKDKEAVKLANEILEKYSHLREKKVKSEEVQRGPLEGTPVQEGYARGKVRVIEEESNADELRDSEILVTKKTSAKFTAIIDKAKAIITDTGGLTSHAAILARERNIPCIVGTRFATEVLETGDEVELDAENGIVRKIE